MVYEHYTRSVDGLVQWGMCRGHMHGGVVVQALSVHTVLRLGHFGLLLSVCLGNTGLVKAKVGCVGVCLYWT